MLAVVSVLFIFFDWKIINLSEKNFDGIVSCSRFADSFFFQAEDGIRDYKVTGVQTCALPIWPRCRILDVQLDLFVTIRPAVNRPHIRPGPAPHNLCSAQQRANYPGRSCSNPSLARQPARPNNRSRVSRLSNRRTRDCRATGGYDS